MQGARESLGRARLMLLFTPELCAGRDPLEVLEAALPEVDAVQVRVKRPGRRDGPSPARELYEWTGHVLDLVASRSSSAPSATSAAGARVPVLVNDRVDVALALAGRGCAGVHLGQTDAPPALAREQLGPDALIGLSTHSAAELAAAEDQPVDYLGFGPIHPGATRGNDRGLGPEAAWIAHAAAGRPLFPIGGIDPENAAELAPVGRAAVSSAILAAPDPAAAARAIRAALAEPD